MVYAGFANFRKLDTHNFLVKRKVTFFFFFFFFLICEVTFEPKKKNARCFEKGQRKAFYELNAQLRPVGVFGKTLAKIVETTQNR